MMTEERISELTTLGFKRWTKGNMDRLYINASTLGLECDYYNTGNIHYATFRGKSISNNMARGMKFAKTYIDIKTGIVHSDSYTLEQAAKELAGIEI